MIVTLTGTQVQPSGVSTDIVIPFHQVTVSGTSRQFPEIVVSGYPGTIILTASGGITPSTIDVTVVLPTPPPPNDTYHILLDYYKDSGMLPVWEGQYNGTFTIASASSSGVSSSGVSSSGVSSSGVSSLSLASSSSAPSSSSQGSLSSISSQSLTSLISTGSGVSASSSGTTGNFVPVNNYYVNLRGWEVGQRTNEFLSDYAHTETSTLVWRDELATTEVRTRQQLIHYDYGDAGIPSWLKGAKSFDVLNGLVPYPDRSILRALTDLFRARVFSLPIEQAMSCFGPGTDLETGKQNIRFRKAFFMSAALSTTDPSGFTYSPGDAVTSGLFSTSGTVTIREAASYWDFSTAFDPVYLALDTEEGYLFRNLDPVTQFISSTTAPVSTIITDDPVAFIWAGSPSLSDSTYMPPAMAERLEAPGLDLSGGVLSAGGSPSASFLSPGLSLTYPVSQFTTS